MGPRKLSEGREREKTLPLEEQLTPNHLEVQALEEDQFERRFPCGSESRRNCRRVAVSLGKVEDEQQWRREKERRKRRRLSSISMAELRSGGKEV